MYRRLKHAFRPTIRLRLTLLYGSLFLVAGIFLLAITYGLLRHSLAPPPKPKDNDAALVSSGHGGGPPKDSAPNNSDGQNDPSGGAIDHGGSHSDDSIGGQVTVGGATGQSTGSGAGENQAGGNATFDQSAVDQQVFNARVDERASALQQVLTQSAIALILTSAGALILGWIVAGRALRPVQQITSHAMRASQATLGDRIDLGGPRDELRELADTIDAMLDRLQAAFDAQRHFAATASHELRTPLAIIRAEADVAMSAPDATPREKELGTAIAAAADRSERLVAGLLALARSESTLRDDAEIDLAEIAGDVVGDLVREADAAGVELDLDLGRAVVLGDRALLERLVGNLIENAIRHNVPDGWVRIAVSSTKDEAILRVSNSGPAIADESVEELFEPFQRGSETRRNRRPGFGLGLAIVKSVASVHGGSVSAAPGEAGGLTVTVRLPTGATV